MTFWDSSALVALVSGEEDADELETVLASDDAIGLWWGSRVEWTSAICRVRRAGKIDELTASRLLREMEEYVAGADEVEPLEDVRATACRLLRIHALRAADARQLAAALVWADHRPSGIGFVCLDRRLRTAAEWEGFEVRSA